MKLSDMQEGARVRLAEVVELYPIGIFPVGLTGTVVATELHCPDRPSVEVKLDQYHEDLAEWDNCLFVYGDGGEESEDECTAAKWEPVTD